METTPIVRFNGSNFNLWRMRLECVLLEKDLFEALDDAPEDERELQWWKIKDRKAKACLLLRINDDLVESTSEMGETTMEVLEAMKRRYASVGMVSQLTARREVLELRMKEGEDIKSHISHLEASLRKLKLAGGEMADPDCIATLLLSLPPSWQPMRLLIENRVDAGELTFEVVKGILMGEQRSRDAVTSQTVKTESVAVVKEKYQGRKVNSNTVRLCYSCSLPGHIAKDCPKKNLNSTPRTTKKECENCHLKNHTTAECRKKKQTLLVVEQLHTVTSEQPTWVIDSGASSHMCHSAEMFINMRDVDDIVVVVADRRELRAHAIGTVLFQTVEREFIVEDCLFVPELGHNLLSVPALTKKKFQITFSEDFCTFGDVIVPKKGNLYLLECLPAKKDQIRENASFGQQKECLELWHRRLGHLNELDIKRIVEIKGDLSFCDICQFGKSHRLPFPDSETRAKDKLEIIHTDVLAKCWWCAVCTYNCR
eukprot:Pompholyxophrys_punicea_v1_NODE_55_length_4195_cov_3.523671.p2 type:complete len:484 gc:universal NODE_55_length_4195_cov_3.523671:106-1557(+)